MKQKKHWVRFASMACGGALLLVCLANGFPTQYRQKEPITFDINSPDPGTYVLMNQEQNIVLANIEDLDEVYDDCLGQWFTYGDDCKTGSKKDDYHMIWTATAGHFDTIDGPCDEGYGSNVTWVAPDGISETVQDVTVWMTSDDINRSPDTSGYDDTALCKSIALKAWRLDVTSKTTGQTTDDDENSCYGYYAHANCWGTDEEDERKLGYVSPNQPVGCEGWGGKIEMKGEIPTVVPEAKAKGLDYKWVQQMTGYVRARSSATGEWYYPDGFDCRDDWCDDSPPCIVADVDPSAPSGPQPPGYFPGNSYVRKLFMLDVPSFIVGVDRRETADDHTDLEYMMEFRTFVTVGGMTASNVYYWEFNNGHWKTRMEGAQWKWYEYQAPDFP